MPLLPLVLVACTPSADRGAPDVSGARATARPPEPKGPSAARVRASFAAGEVVVSAPWPGAPEVGLSLVGWEAVAPSVVGGRTTYPRDGLLEWWERGPKGLEQGFLVDHPPAGGALVLELALRGATAGVDADGRSATLHAEAGGQLRYEGLAAWDATGADLPARMEATDRGLRLVVDTTGAVAPITIDPMLAAPVWTAEGNQDYAGFGSSVAPAGDVNGDGYGDLIVGAHTFDGVRLDMGAAAVFLGSAAGLSAGPAWMPLGDAVANNFGSSVASAGDVNGDGYDDVIVGAPRDDDGDVDEGTASLYVGSAAGLSAVAAWIRGGDQAGAGFGTSVASAGDVNGDGYDDVIVGAQYGDDGEVDEGVARLYLGSAAGLAAAPAWSAGGDQADASFGHAVASAGDVNGDGYDDVIVGAAGYDGGLTNEGVARLYLGSAAGLSASPAWTVEGDEQGAPSATRWRRRGTRTATATTTWS